MNKILLIAGTILTQLAMQAYAVNQIRYDQKKSDQMGKDSTDLVPFDGLLPSVNTATTNLTSPTSITYGGQCGASNNSYLPSAPDRFLCESGAASTVSTVVDSTIMGGEKYSWTCTGTAANSAVSCSASKKITGSCGNANGKVISNQPSGSEMCATGQPSGYQQSGNTATWSCDGTPYQTSASCSATIQATSTGVNLCVIYPLGTPTPPTIRCKTPENINMSLGLYRLVPSAVSDGVRTWRWSCSLQVRDSWNETATWRSSSTQFCSAQKTSVQ